MRRRGGRTWQSPAAAASLLATALIALPAGRALAATSCSYDAGTHVVTVVLGANYIEVARNGPDLYFDSQNCGTVTTVDTVNIDMNHTSDATLNLDLDGGPFVPGFTVENNGSGEIEMSLTNLGDGTEVTVEGSADSESFAVGDRVLATQETVTGINLNRAADGATADEDVVIHGRAAQMGVSGGNGNDTISGAGTGTPLSKPTSVQMILNDGPGQDTVTGGSSNDLIGPQQGPDPGDTFSGGGNYDFIDYEGWSTGVSVSLDGKPNDGASCPGPTCDGDNVHSDIESIRGTVFSDVLIGGAGPQSLEGASGNNIIDGGRGDDRLFGGPGTDVFQGGPGTDSVSYYAATGPVSVTLDGHTNDGQQGEHDNVAPDVEVVSGGPDADHLVGNSRANTLYGDRGSDRLDGRGGDDTLDGGGQSAGADGSDVFIGGTGTDTVVEDSPTGKLTLSIDGHANDEVIGDPSQGVDNIHTDVENVTGSAGDDRIVGDNAANRLVGGFGNDVLIGGGGNDVLMPGAGTDQVRGGAGLDTASYADATARVSADLLAGTASGDGDDALASIGRLVGSVFGDHLIGSQGPDALLGGRGNDVLKGLAGNDLILGGPGNDTINGGPGSDKCRQSAGTGHSTHCER